MSSDNREFSLPRRVWNLIHRSSSSLAIIDPQFRRQPSRYFVQGGLATIGMFAVLLFVDSFSDAALVAALGASVVIIFVHPTSKLGAPRALVGGHLLGLLIGSVFSLILFAPPVNAFLEGVQVLRDLALAASVGAVIVLMAITDTEHPPAGGTVLGMSTRVFDPSIFAIIIGAVIVLAVTKRVLRRYLRDLM
ncbi:MAG TPA: HPP family protein [Dehalococcoidia bacterium]|jgi:CBS-domain-containing membrane protein|nr:HPP family protein [Dehalococcoidia bacterium]